MVLLVDVDDVIAFRNEFRPIVTEEIERELRANAREGNILMTRVDRQLRNGEISEEEHAELFEIAMELLRAVWRFEHNFVDLD